MAKNSKNNFNYGDGFGPTVLSYTELQSIKHNRVALSDKLGAAYFSVTATIALIIRQINLYGNVACLYSVIYSPFLTKTSLRIGYNNDMS
jgi:hypothetical protein